MSNLLDIKDLKTHFYTERGKVTALRGIDFTVNKGEIVGLVGESGCGKSVTSQSILRLFDEKNSVEYEGEINFEEKNILKFSLKNMESLRGNEISMVFQDPLSSLNPVYTIGKQIREALILHQKISKKEANEKAIELLKLTGIPAPERRIKEYPHQLSGGMRQRVMIAIALACNPKLLIADEPTTALDVTIQSQILDLLVELNKKLDMAILLITHDLGVVAEVCEKVVVMYLGQIVEETDVKSLFDNPKHPYTKGLLKAIPRLTGDRGTELNVIPGTVPSLNQVPNGCGFAPRCLQATDICHRENPQLKEIYTGHKVRCWNVDESEGGMKTHGSGNSTGDRSYSESR